VADESAIARSREKTGVDESTEDGVTRGFVETPKAARLLGRQPQAGHLEKLSANSVNDLLNPSARLNHRAPRLWVDRHVDLVCVIHTRCQHVDCAKFGRYFGYCRPNRTCKRRF